MAVMTINEIIGRALLKIDSEWCYLPENLGGIELHINGTLNPESIGAAMVKALGEAGYAVHRGWQPAETAPKNGTWLLLRGRNAVGHPMIPVVAAWMPAGAKHQGWVDSSTFKPVDNLAADVGADWMPLPDE